jgi:hypothetical protein
MDLKNDVVAHEASLKAAKTSYFKLILCGIETVQGTKSSQYPTDSK